MPEEIMAPRETGPGVGSTSTQNNNYTDLKWRRVLRLLVKGARLTRFDAEKIGDHAFNSTVAALGAMGVSIAREPITIQGRFGPIHCKRYWLEPKHRGRAWILLGERP